MVTIEKIGLNVKDLIKPSDEKTIILWGADSLLTWYVSQLLDMHEAWQVTRITNGVPEDFPMRELERLHPDVVLLCGEHDDQRDCLPTRLLNVYPRMKVLTVNLENNFVQINNCQKIEIDKTSDLLAIVED